MIRRSAGVALAVLGAAFSASPAAANWIGSQPYEIAILVDGNIVEILDDANDVAPDDVIYRVSIGDGRLEEEGELTVVGEGSGTNRKQLGGWHVDYGTGNIQSVIGTGGFVVGEGNGASDLPGALHVLNSDLDGDIRVYDGSSLWVQASTVGSVEVFEASAYIENSRINTLWTHAGSYTRMQGSIAVALAHCPLRGTVDIEDSTLRCGSAQIELDADVDLSPVLTSSVTLEVTGLLRVDKGSFRVSHAIATTGSVEVAADDGSLHILDSTWTNAGGVQIKAGASEPTDMTVGGGSTFHEMGTVRVSGLPAFQVLTVTDPTTEFEIDGDLRIGEYLIGSLPYAYSGNVTVKNGATLIVHGTLALNPLGVLNLESGAKVYAASLDDAGTINENGGELIVPEPAETSAAASATVALCALVRRRRIRR